MIEPISSESEKWDDEVVYHIYRNDDLETLPVGILEQMANHIQHVIKNKTNKWIILSIYWRGDAMSKYEDIFQKNNHIPYGECLGLYVFEGVIEIEMEYYEDYNLCEHISIKLSKEEARGLANSLLEYLNRNE